MFGNFLRLLFLALFVLSCAQSEVRVEDRRRSELQRLRSGLPALGVETPRGRAGDGEVFRGSIEVRTPDFSADVVMLSPVPPQESPSELVLGEFPLARQKKAILDGDTIRVEGLEGSLRLLAIDTEETFKSDAQRREAAVDFGAYARAKREQRAFPVKYGTPMGEEALRWAESFFGSHSVVRLEYDDRLRDLDLYGRHLVYVMVERGGRWVNYNVECVRAGMSPYFTKYGYSRRFHDEFVAAQAEAQAAARGIWAAGAEAYPDYEERLRWWNRRGNALVVFETRHGGREGVVHLGHEPDYALLAEWVGEVVTVFGTLGERRTEGLPHIARLPHVRGESFSLVAFSEAEWDAMQLDAFAGDYFYVRGKLSEYGGRYQFKVTDIEAIWVE